MKGVAPYRRPSASSRAVSGALNKTGCAAPRLLGATGRGQSKGSSSGGTPPSKRRSQGASSAVMVSASSHCRCQTEKSAYWISRSGSGDGRPWAKAP